MQMDHIRIPVFYFPDQLSGLPRGRKAVLAFEKSCQHMFCHIRFSAKFPGIQSVRRTASAVSDQRAVPVFLQYVVNIHRNTAHASAPAYGVDLQNFQSPVPRAVVRASFL